MPGLLRQSAAVFLAVVLAVAAHAGAARAAGDPLQLTVAARSCPAYTDVTANRARNNIQESLQDLGADTAYAAGDAISPAVEDAHQPNCVPITGWTFTLGTDIVARAVSGIWGALSIVTNPFSGAPATKASVPLLDTNGHATGDRIAGAATITLTGEQAALATRSSSLWIQGGTPTDPVLDQRFPSEYGFAALRCAIDDLNGDNVEWISYPEGAEHVFCYAYYVKPPPTSGTIIVRKVVDAPPEADSRDFDFSGNISYEADQAFTVNAAPGRDGAATFYRAEVGTQPGDATQPWAFAEQVPAGWQLTGLTCASQTGASSTTTDLRAAAASVRLAAGDVVTCTYTDRLIPPPAGLTLAKLTLGGAGTFGFDVTGPQPATASVTTTAAGAPAVSAPTLSLPAGDYTLDETHAPVSADGTWKLTDVRCNENVIAARPAPLTLVSGQGQLCQFTNTFTPAGVIRVRKSTRGAVGTTGFLITQADDQTHRYEQTATTTAQNEPVLATGDRTSELPLGTYVVQETTPTGGADGVWSLDALICDGVPIPTAQGAAHITLTADEPVADCTFTNRFDRGGVSPGGGSGGSGGGTGGGGTGGGGGSAPVVPTGDLVVTKRVAPHVVRVGGLLDYTVTVTNVGKVSADEVTVVEHRRGRIARLTLHTSKGTCVARFPAVCRIGTLKPGQRVTVHGRVRPGITGTFRNAVAVNTSSAERRNADNRAATQVRVIARPRFTG